MANELLTEVEQAKEQEDVKRALKQTTSKEPKEQPKARTKDKVWLGTHIVIVLALGTPKEAGRVKTRMMKRLLAELNAAPDRVLFPKSNAR